jgi:AraC-like DNA-binding protein
MATLHELQTGRIRAKPALVVQKHSSELGSWESVLREPSPLLRGHIDGSYQGWVENSNGLFRRREVPSTIVALIVSLGRPYGLVDPKNPSAKVRTVGTFVAGLHESFAVTESSGSHFGVQVNFTPLGAHAFFGLAMHTFANRVTEVGDVWGAATRRLESQMLEAPDWQSRFDVLEAFIMARMLAAKPASPEVEWAWRTLNATGGTLNIRNLAAELGWSHRHLIAKFREQIGLPPKTLARIVRFQRAIDMLKRDDSMRQVDVALDCGYYDQAHLIRDFHEFAGDTPNDFLARRLPDGGGLKGD